MAKIRAVIFDWAGTTIDHGCFAPVASFVEAFAQRGVEVSPTEARGPMGLHKKDHIREMLQIPAVAERWKAAHGKDWTEEDVEGLFKVFIPLQLEVVERHSELMPGLLETVTWLRERDIRIGGTTGYFKEAAERAIAAAEKQGYKPDLSLCPDDGVPQGRPAPWMIFRLMEQFNVYPPTAVLKVGDTRPDMEEGRNAGVWTIGVTDTGSEVGLTREEWEALTEEQRKSKRAAVAEKLRTAGAHAVIGSVRDVPYAIEQIEA